MKGIINSELNPEQQNPSALFIALKQQDYLVALMQKNFFDSFKYDYDAERFRNITPRSYVDAMSKALRILENDIFSALETASNSLEKDLGINIVHSSEDHYESI